MIEWFLDDVTIWTKFDLTALSVMLFILPETK